MLGYPGPAAIAALTNLMVIFLWTVNYFRAPQALREHLEFTNHLGIPERRLFWRLDLSGSYLHLCTCFPKLYNEKGAKKTEHPIDWKTPNWEKEGWVDPTVVGVVVEDAVELETEKVVVMAKD